MSGAFHYFIILSWILMSAASVTLSLKVIGWAQKEKHESELDLAALYELGYHEKAEKRDKIILAEDEVAQAIKLLRVQILFGAHQTLFLLVGLLAFGWPAEPRPEDYTLLVGVIEPLMLIMAQFLIVAGQVFIASIIFGKSRTRLTWQARYEL